jgi:co-chaperonin GroES (HSP10)
MGWLDRLVRDQSDLDAWSVDVSLTEIGRMRARVKEWPGDCDPVRLGDRVVFSWSSGHQVAIDGVRYLILRVDDILGVLE